MSNANKEYAPYRFENHIYAWQHRAKFIAAIELDVQVTFFPVSVYGFQELSSLIQIYILNNQ